MRFILIIGLLILIAQDGAAQSHGRRRKKTISSAASGWQKVKVSPASPIDSTVKPVAEPAASTKEPASVIIDRPAPVTSRTPLTLGTAEFRPAFTGDFATNRNGWRAGNRGDYHYQIGLGQYSIRKRVADTQQQSFSAVELPSEINLNAAEYFTIKLDVLADSGQVPSGGLLFGVRDSLNYNGFMLNAKGEIAVTRIINGHTASDYMSGEFFAPGVAVEKNRNRLIIQRRGNALHFYINGQEIRSSPYPFRILAGNGIGLRSSGYWTAFQKLTVTLGL